MAKREEKKEEEKDTSFVEKMIKSRTVMVSKPVDDKLVEAVASQIFLMQSESEKDPIYVYINSPGGSADSGFAIYDLLSFISPPVVTLCSGICASAAVMIYLGGDRGKRFSLPNSRFLLHQPSTQAQGTASDLQITAQEIIKLRERYNHIVGEETGKDVKQVTEDSIRDFWLSPEEAVKYGLVDAVVSSKKELEGKLKK